MSLKEKITMTEAEEAAFTEKINSLNEFARIFIEKNHNNIKNTPVNFNSTFYQNFTFKEFFHSRFVEVLQKVRSIFAFYSSWSYIRYLSVITEIFKANREDFRNLTYDEWKEFFKYLLDNYKDPSRELLRSTFFEDFYDLFANDANTAVISRCNYFYVLDEVGFFNKDSITSTSVPDKCIEKTLLDKNTADLEKFVKFVSDKCTYYHNFSPILFGETLELEDRKRILKAVYRQKDLPKYKELLRKGRKRFDIMDAFIDQTVINNNRVTEKEQNIIRLLGDVYITSEYYYNNNMTLRNTEDIDKEYPGIKGFAEHYRSYFLDKIFVTRLYSQTVNAYERQTYRRKEEYDAFMKLLYTQYTGSEILEMLNKDAYCRADLLNEATAPFADVLSKKFGESDEINEKLIKFFITTNRYNCIFKNGANIDLSKHSHIFEDYAGSTIKLRFRDSDKITEGYSDYFYSLVFNPAIYSKVRLFESMEVQAVYGFVYNTWKQITKENNQRRYSNNANYSTRKNWYDLIITMIDTYIKNEEIYNSPEASEAFYQNFIKQFEENDALGYAATNIPSFDTDEKEKMLEGESYYWRTNSTTVVSAFLEITKKIKNQVEHVLEETNRSEMLAEITDNINNTISNIELLCSINDF